MEKLKLTLGVGEIYKNDQDSIQYKVQSIKELGVIIDHFEKYPLISKKQADYMLFKMAVELITRKEHLTIEGLKKIIAIKASMNKGLSDELKAVFSPDLKPVERPHNLDCKIIDPNWLAGFSTGEGCFSVGLKKAPTHLSGFQVILIFQLTQHNRDEQLMTSFIDYLGCGNVYKVYKDNEDSSCVRFTVTKFNDLTDKVIPFFNKYPIFGVKYLDYLDFVQIVELMKVKAHLTSKGLDQIRKIKAGMNTGRK